MVKLSTPISVHFEVTDSCNNYCAHCYGNSWIKHVNEAKPEIIDVAEKIADSEVFAVTITGGEPLLIGLDKLSKIFKLFDEHNIKYSLNTNGRLLKKETCKLLKQEGLNQVLISLHSWIDALHDEIVDCPNAAIETKAGIQNALNEGLQVTVNQVIDKRNIDTAYASSKKLVELGVDQLSLTRMVSPLGVDHQIEMVNATRFLDEFIKCKENLGVSVSTLLPIPLCSDPRAKDLDKKLNCSGGISSAVISCYGDVRFCPHDLYAAGNIFQEELSQIWRRIMKWRNEIASPLECKNCSFFEDCHGGCRVASKLCLNDWKAMDPWAREAVTNYQRIIKIAPFDPEGKYALFPGVCWRKENGAYLLNNNGSYLFVNSDGVNFLAHLPEIFVPNELITATAENREKQLKYLQILYYNGMLAKIPKSGSPSSS